MKVFFWCDAFRPNIGGVEELAWQFLRAMNERGHQFAVITHRDDDTLPAVTVERDIRIYRLPFRRAVADRNAAQLLALRKEAMRIAIAVQPDLVHLYFTGYSAAFLIPIVKALNSPTLVTLHNDTDVQTNESTIAGVMNCADWVVGCSHSVFESIPSQFRCPENKISVIHNGVRAPTVAPTQPNADKPYLLCARRLVYDKGVDVAIAMMTHVHTQFPNIRLLIAGSGPERARLEQQAAESGLTQIIEFLGPVSAQDMPHLIRQATLVLLPSRREGLPLSALEAAWLERPIVGTQVGGIPEFVIHEHNGLLVPSGDSLALANAVCELLAHPQRLAEMGHAALKRVERHFSWERHVAQYDNLYASLDSFSLGVRNA